MRTLIFSALWAMLLLPLTGHTQTRVLFLGNSFTIGATAPVPTIFDRLAQAGGKGDPTTVMQAVGGTDFQYHASNSLGSINSQLWDYVVLQNYSTEPTHFVDGSHSIADHMNFGNALYNAIMLKNPATKVVLFETWSRAAAHEYITGTSTPTSFASTAQMQSELRTNYANLANTLNASHPGNPPVRVAPVGTAWENAGGLRAASGDPQFVDLHGSDNYHGDDDGYYLTAAVIYSSIYGTSPQGLSTHTAVSTLNLSRNVSAQQLENVAWSTVQSVPEPSTAGLLGLSGVWLLSMRRRHLRLNRAGR
jgi:hypothetical protein